MEKFVDKIKGLVKNKAFVIGAASFMLPTLVLYVIFALNGVHPFGDKQILVTDLWHQYYPFLCTLQEKLQAGESLLYSETIGMGINFLALIAYYCASPLNILVTFVTKEGLRDLLTVIVALKMGFSGLFFSFYLRKVFKNYDFSTVAFSAVYALCGYMLGYYWNIMWLDCVALLPLVMLGVYSLVKENKVILYVVSLAVAVISNFYIGFMVCIFTAIYFFFECVRSEVNFKEFFKKLALIAITSVLALALTAFISIPAYNALGDTVSTVEQKEDNSNESFGEKLEQFGEDFVDAVEEFGKDLPDIVGRTASFNEPVPKTGLPNIFSGFISIILLGYFFCAGNIKLREKISTAVVIFVLLASMAVSDLDIIWHGFHKPNMVPYRYAFVFSFMLVITAYRTYMALFESKPAVSKLSLKTGFITSLALSVIVIVCAYKEAQLATIFGCAALAIVYFVVITSCLSERSSHMKEKWTGVLCSVIIIEVLINTIIAVPVVRTTTYSTYYYRGEEIERLLEAANTDETYGRVETAQEYILNDSALYGFKGVSTFTSTANYPVTKFLEKLALCAPAKANRYYYETTSPLTNAFLGVEYVIFKNNMKNLNPYLNVVASEKTEDGKYENTICANTQTLPIGFMVENALLNEEGLVGENAFDVQNDLFRKATGLDGDLFTRVPLKTVAAENTVKVAGSREGIYTLTQDVEGAEPVMNINYVAPDENSIYAYVDCNDISKINVLNTTYKVDKRKYIFPAGSYDEGEKFTFKFAFGDTFKDKSSLKFHVYSMNEKLFEQGMEILRDEPFDIDVYKSTYIEGSVNVKEDGVFYTSIPYEKGWKMYVDGKKTEITPLEGAFIATPLTKGEHIITLKYSPYGFKTGVIISVIGLIVLMAMIVIKRRREKNGQNINSSSVL